MTDTIRCSSCGATNRAGAEWCAQCLRRFVAPPPPPPQRTLSSPADVSTPAGTRPPDAGSAPAREGRRGAFEVTAQGITWTCPRCENVNDLGENVCRVCGTRFAEFVTPAATRPKRDPGTAALYSLFLPGAGHAYLGMWPQAIARAAVSLWVLFVVLATAFQRGAGGSLVIMVAFGFAALALWVVAAHDAYREANEEPTLVILKGKVFLYVVLGLLVLLVGLMVPAILRIS